MKIVFCMQQTNIRNSLNLQGAICLDTLSTAWSPVLTIKSTLLSLQSLFESPEPKDPQDAEVAKMMMTDPPAFNKKAHEWAVQHASAPRNPTFQSVQPRSGIQQASQAIDESRYVIRPSTQPRSLGWWLAWENQNQGSTAWHG